METSDVEGVLNLLQITFSEDHYTSRWWDWKYSNNPQGTPILLVAEEDTMIVGLRAFWPRIILLDGERLLAHQAVDTAVHPNYRGQGLFTSLTKAGLVLLRENGSIGVYNFPNPQSAPGYLKLGWKQFGRFRWWIRGIPSSGRDKAIDWDKASLTADSKPKTAQCKNRFSRDSDYVRWRYLNHPYNHYSLWDLGTAAGERLYAVTHIVRRKVIPVQMIIDIIGHIPDSEDAPKALLRALIKNLRIEPFKTLCVQERSLGCGTKELMGHGFVPVPKVGVNYFVYPMLDDARVQEFFGAVNIYPGDIDTF